MAERQRRYIAIPTPEEVEPVLARISDEKARVMLRLAWDACLKVAVIIALRWEQFDLPAGTLTVEGRCLSLPEPLLDALSALPKAGPWLFPGQKGNACLHRVSASRLCREVLDAAGGESLTLENIRAGGIQRRVEKDGLRKAAVFAGVDMRSIQMHHKDHSDAPVPSRRPVVKAPRLNAAALERALEQEGDTLAARAVRLSWQGGLMQPQITALRWEDVSLTDGAWRLGDDAAPIPEPLRPHLARWQAADEGKPGYVLRRRKSSKPIPAEQMSQQIEELFARQGLDGYTLLLLRGQGTSTAALRLERAAHLEGKCLAQLQETGVIGVQSAAKLCGISAGDARRLLEDMEARGLIRSREIGRGYVLPEAVTPRERFEGFLDDCRQKRIPVTAARLCKVCGMEPNVAGYYLRYAVAEGRLERIEKGVYRLKDSL